MFNHCIHILLAAKSSHCCAFTVFKIHILVSAGSRCFYHVFTRLRELALSTLLSRCLYFESFCSNLFLDLAACFSLRFKVWYDQINFIIFAENYLSLAICFLDCSCRFHFIIFGLWRYLVGSRSFLVLLHIFTGKLEE